MMRVLAACTGALALTVYLYGCGGGGGGGSLAGAEPARTGNIVGEVRGTDGLPVANALLTVRGTNLSVRSEADGHFFLGSVPIGNQIIDVTSNSVVVSVSTAVTEGQTTNVGTVSVNMTGSGTTGGGTTGGGTTGGGTSNAPPPPPF